MCDCAQIPAVAVPITIHALQQDCSQLVVTVDGIGNKRDPAGERRAAVNRLLDAGVLACATRSRREQVTALVPRHTDIDLLFRSAGGAGLTVETRTNQITREIASEVVEEAIYRVLSRNGWTCLQFLAHPNDSRRRWLLTDHTTRRSAPLVQDGCGRRKSGGYDA
jgi:hypothetical protein